MRYKKRVLVARKNKILPIRFIKQDLTTYSGLVLVDHFFRLYKIHSRVKETFRRYKFSGDYSIGDILFVLLIMILVGAERLRHLDYLKTDPLFCRVVRLTHIPHRTKISTSLKQFTSGSLKALIELNSEFVIEKIESLGLNEVTIDLDGTLISTKGNPSWAFKGYNPIKRGAKSYFPITAHIAETGHFLSILNRPGNIHDSYRALYVIKMIQRQMKQFTMRFRADSAFCVPQVINYLLRNNIAFAIKAPFWKLLSLKESAQHRKRWFRIDYTWSYFRIKNPIDSLEYEHYVFVLRKRLKDLESGQENSIGELKSNFAFDHIPTNTYQANSAYMQMSQMAYNLSISMQHEMGLARKNSSNPKTTRVYQTRKWKTFRFLIVNRAGRIGWEQGKKVLDLTYNQATKKLYDRIVASLENQNFRKAA